MSMRDYMAATRDTEVYGAAIDDQIDFNTKEQQSLMGRINYAALELANEAGEVAGKVKKIIRDSQGVVRPEHTAALADELGDVIYPWVRLCDHLGIDPDTVLQRNLDKLADRKARGVIRGSGDNR